MSPSSAETDTKLKEEEKTCSDVVVSPNCSILAVIIV